MSPIIAIVHHFVEGVQGEPLASPTLQPGDLPKLRVPDLRCDGVQKGNSSRDVLSRGSCDSIALCTASTAGVESAFATQEIRESTGTAGMYQYQGTRCTHREALELVSFGS